MTDLFFIGVDGGGTGCRARVRDANGQALGEGTGGPANVRLGADRAREAILTACRGAMAAAGLSDEDLARAHVGLGLAGAIASKEAGSLLAGPLPFASAVLDTDAYTAWLGAFRGQPGAILILGTGSCGFGVFDGKPTYVGGWGNVISDEGSGATIGREAVRRALWALDGRIAATPLSNAILAAHDRSPEQVVAWADGAKPADFARWTPVVLDHARRGDPLGAAIIEGAAADIARMAERLLGLGAPALCLMGGLAQPLLPWLPARIRERVVPPQADAMDGAILMARRAAGL
jgi:glucosamine kinase